MSLRTPRAKNFHIFKHPYIHPEVTCGVFRALGLVLRHFQGYSTNLELEIPKVHHRDEMEDSAGGGGGHSAMGECKGHSAMGEPGGWGYSAMGECEAHSASGWLIFP